MTNDHATAEDAHLDDLIAAVNKSKRDQRGILVVPWYRACPLCDDPDCSCDLMVCEWHEGCPVIHVGDSVKVCGELHVCVACYDDYEDAEHDREVPGEANDAATWGYA